MPGARAVDSNAPDDQLLARVRSGDLAAYSSLWRKHHRAGLAAARACTTLSDPEDLVSEAFAAILITLQRGKGPDSAFRPYLFSVIRNLAAWWAQRRHEVTLEDFDPEDPRLAQPDAAALDDGDRALVVRAFGSLPARWQEILWCTEVEGLTPAEVAPLMRISANSAAALSYRAREGLRRSWIREQLAVGSGSEECRWVRERLERRARGKLRSHEAARVAQHLDGCGECPQLADEAERISLALAGAMLPAVLGAGAAAYLSLRPAPTSAAAASSAHAALPAFGAKAVLSAVGGLAAAVALTAIVVLRVSAGQMTLRDAPVSPAASASAAGAAPGSVAVAVGTVVDTCDGLCLPLITGVAPVGARVELAGPISTTAATADASGHWRAALVDLPEGASSIALTIDGRAVGEVHVEVRAPRADIDAAGMVTVAGVPGATVMLHWPGTEIEARVTLDRNGEGRLSFPGASQDSPTAAYAVPAGRQSLTVPARVIGP